VCCARRLACHAADQALKGRQAQAGADVIDAIQALLVVAVKGVILGHLAHILEVHLLIS
jgi:hypothetical protein